MEQVHQNRISLAFTLIAGIYGFAGVLVGALTGHDERLAEIYLQVAQMYFFIHTIALFCVANTMSKYKSHNPKELVFAGICFVLGTPAFSISLFVKVSLHMSIPLLMPLGGTLMLMGWVGIFLYALKKIFK